jgi:hypothetical protein
MVTPEKRMVTVLLTEMHLRKMIDNRLLKEDEISDQAKVARVVCTENPMRI